MTFRHLVVAIIVIAGTMLWVSSNAGSEEKSWKEYERLGDEAKETGNWSQAGEAYEKAIGVRDVSNPRQLENDTAALLNKLGETQFREKKYKNAEVAYRRALSIYDWNLGPDDPKVAETLDLLATTFQNQENGFAFAGPLYYRALAIREKAFGPDHLEVAESLQKVGLSLHFQNGRLPIALPLFKRALEIRKKALGHDSLVVADSLVRSHLCMICIMIAPTRYLFMKRGSAPLFRTPS